MDIYASEETSQGSPDLADRSGQHGARRQCSTAMWRSIPPCSARSMRRSASCRPFSSNAHCSSIVSGNGRRRFRRRLTCRQSADLHGAVHHRLAFRLASALVDGGPPIRASPFANMRPPGRLALQHGRGAAAVGCAPRARTPGAQHLHRHRARPLPAARSRKTASSSISTSPGSTGYAQRNGPAAAASYIGRIFKIMSETRAGLGRRDRRLHRATPRSSPGRCAIR